MITFLHQRNRWKHLLLMSFILLCNIANAQNVTTYGFAHSIGTYTQVNDALGTDLPLVKADSYISPAQNIGFNFVYEGTTYTQFKMASNGFISLGSGTAVLTANNLSTANATSRPIIAPLWDDLDGNATGNVSKAIYELTGIAPNRVLTVEWRNWEWNWNSANPVMSFQVKLYETTNVIEFVYRQETGSVNSGTASIGIGSATGSGNGSYLNVTSVTTPAVSSTSSVTNISTKPANNQVFTFSPPAPCNSQPPLGQTTASVTNACSNQPFTLGVSGLPVITGVTYEFQSSPAGTNNFTSLGAPQSSSTFTINSQAAPTDYRVIITCTAATLSTTATFVNVGQNLYYNCHCIPVSGCVNEGIDSVAFGTFSNTSGTCTNSSGYTNYANLGSVASVNQGDMLALTVKAKINSNPASAGVWIDFNQNSIFEATEYTSLGSATVTIPSGGTPYIFSANVPIDANATTGITRMRIRSANQNGITNTSSCITSSAFGEFEDYLITINPGIPCAGTPNAGSITTAPTTVCPSVNFTLTASGFTSGVTGLNYQWQVYNSATTTWGPAPGTNNLMTYTGSITSPTDFRFSITCTNGNGTAATTPVSIAVTTFAQCYCIPTNTTNTTYFINSFTTTGGLSNISNTNSGLSSGGYGNFSSQIVSVLANDSFTYNATYTTGSTFGTKVWIDWNQNGLFTDAGEQVHITSGYSNTSSKTIVIPPTALPGQTRMRIGNSFTPNTGPAGPCVNNLNGEYEDYTVDIIPLVQCSGTPTAGTASAPVAACVNAPFTLQSTGYTTGLGLTMQWEEAPAGTGLWSTMTGATTATYTITGGITSAMDYQMKITCANGGGNSVSNLVTVGINPFYNCYCTPASGCVNEGIVNVTFDVLNNNSTFCTNTSGYSDFSGLGALATVVQAQTVSISVTGNINSNPASVGVWIDYDHSGTFDTSEYTLIGTSSGISPLPSNYIYSGNIVIDPLALTGITRMRVRQANQSGIAKTSACTNTGVFGEYEDYLININASNNCFGNPTAGVITSPASVCPTIPFSLSTTGTTNGVLGLTYEWQYYNTTTSTWDPAPGTNSNSTYTASTGITVATDYRLKIVCTNGGGFDISTPVTVSISPVVLCYCTPGGTNSTYYINNLSTAGGIMNINKVGSGFSTSGYGDFTTTDTLTVAASNIFTLNAAFGSGTNTFGVKIWIDYDGDGSFAQASDQVYASAAYYNTFSTSITIPPTATPITTRMRIGISFTPNTGPAGPCSVISGEFEDYTIVILPAPSCLVPSGLVANNVTSSAADLNWVENGTATQWRVEYGPTGFTQGTGTVVTVPNKPYNLTGLSPNTQYSYYVRALCSANDSSTNGGPYSFFTTQIPQTVFPYAQNFETGATDWTVSNGTQANKWYVGAPGVNVGTGGLYVSNDGGLTNSYDNILASAVHAYRDLDLTSFSTTVPLTFNAYVVGESCCDYIRVWMVPTSYQPTPGTQIVASTGLTQLASINVLSAWTPYNLTIPTSYTGGVARLVIEWRNDPSLGSAPAKLDDLTIGGFPLSITLRDINAENVGNRNRINWFTEAEFKSDVFELERSLDGIEFSKLATINAKGEASTYTYWDEAPVSGVNHYRLKMMDAIGKFYYSKTVSATLKGEGAFTVQAFPNPVSDQLTVVVRGTKADNALVRITDLTGKVIRTISMDKETVTIDMKGLAQGFYLVKYTDGSNAQTIKVSKQ